MLDPDGEMRHLHPDGKGYRDDNDAETKTHWEDGRLVVETKTSRGETKETWEVAGEPLRMTVLVKMKRSSSGEVTVKRVFDAVHPEAHTP